MDEKEMVLDILTGLKSSIGNYAKIITECSNPELRKTFQQMRDEDEKSQYELYKIADEKGYYTPAQKATINECQIVKDNLCAAV